MAKFTYSVTFADDVSAEIDGEYHAEQIKDGKLHLAVYDIQVHPEKQVGSFYDVKTWRRHEKNE